MQLHSERWYLEPQDQIRANRLIQGELDVAGFERWYSELRPSQVAALAAELCYFAGQAGVSVSEFDQAVRNLGPLASPAANEMLRKQLLVRGAYDDRILRVVVESATPEARHSYFWLTVHVLAEAERKHSACGSSPECNHWWHRDLRDELVVREILIKDFGQRVAPQASAKRSLLRTLLSRLLPSGDA